MGVVVSSASRVVAMRTSNEVEVQVIRVLKVMLYMVVFGMQAVQRVCWRVVLGPFEVVQGRLLLGNVLIMANGIVRAQSKHMEDIFWIGHRLRRMLLTRKYPLYIPLEIMTSKVVGHSLVAVIGMCLVRGSKDLMVAWVKSR